MKTTTGAFGINSRSSAWRAALAIKVGSRVTFTPKHADKVSPVLVIAGLCDLSSQGIMEWEDPKALKAIFPRQLSEAEFPVLVHVLETVVEIVTVTDPK